MSKHEYLNEERYQKTKSKLGIIIVVVWLVLISVGGFLVYKGVGNSANSNLSTVENKLKDQKAVLEASGLKYNTFATYDDGDEYNLKIITNALDPSFSYCSFDEYKNNAITKEYCSLKNANGSFSKMVYLMFGGFIIVGASMFCGVLYLSIVKRREIMAYTTQQVMPVAQEGIDKMAPTVADAAGKIAGSIAKGIKEGLKDEEK